MLDKSSKLKLPYVFAKTKSTNDSVFGLTLFLAAIFKKMEMKFN